MSEKQPYVLLRAHDILSHPEFDHSKPTVLYINDCYEVNDESTKVVIAAYLRRKEYNLLALDWSSLGRDDFFNVLIPNIKAVSKQRERSS